MFPRVEFFKSRLFMKPAISEFGILNFKKFRLEGLLQLQLKYALQGPDRSHL